MRIRLLGLVFLIACLGTLPLSAQSETATIPAPEAAANQESKSAGPVANGIVFEDRDGDGRYGEQDVLFSGIKISNGIDIVKTDARGRYSIPLNDQEVIFLIKPSGFRTPLTKNNLPKFFYLHKPDGSPALKYPGAKPTGDLNRSVDFPLYRQDEPDDFKIILFGDPQPRNVQEVDYIGHDVVDELIGSDAAFGVTLGDIAFDHLETFETLNRAIALIGIPWYNVIGNHDINTDATSRKHINETFESTYGPSYYSYDYGQVHFVVMDNIDWATPPNERPTYVPNFGEQQLEFLEKDLAMIPESQMVVLMMHVPLPNTKDHKKLFRLIEERPLCISISGHQHYHQHLFLDATRGWKGDKPHHHIINVTVCGSWWSGQKDERGIPHATMADGAPNGYSTMTFDQNGYRMDFHAAAGNNDQMHIDIPDVITQSEDATTEISANVYNGSERSTVRMRIEGLSEWITLEKVDRIDPVFARIHARENKLTPPPEPRLSAPRVSSHLWAAKISNSLEPGTYLLVVETTDRAGRTYTQKKSFRVEPAK